MHCSQGEKRDLGRLCQRPFWAPIIFAIKYECRVGMGKEAPQGRTSCPLEWYANLRPRVNQIIYNFRIVESAREVYSFNWLCASRSSQMTVANHNRSLEECFQIFSLIYSVVRAQPEEILVRITKESRFFFLNDLSSCLLQKWYRILMRKT